MQSGCLNDQWLPIAIRGSLISLCKDSGLPFTAEGHIWTHQAPMTSLVGEISSRRSSSDLSTHDLHPRSGTRIWGFTWFGSATLPEKIIEVNHRPLEDHVPLQAGSAPLPPEGNYINQWPLIVIMTKPFHQHQSFATSSFALQAFPAVLCGLWPEVALDPPRWMCAGLIEYFEETTM